jgi:hypothetical protein
VQDRSSIRNLSDDFLVRLLSEEGKIIDSLSRDNETYDFSDKPAGFNTQIHDGDAWRVFRQAVQVVDLTGWFEVAQELEPKKIA